VFAIGDWMQPALSSPAMTPINPDMLGLTFTVRLVEWASDWTDPVARNVNVEGVTYGSRVIVAVEVVPAADGVTGFGLNAIVTPGVEDVSVIGEMSPLREPTVIVVVFELPIKILIDVGELIEKSWTLTLKRPVRVFPCASVAE